MKDSKASDNQEFLGKVEKLKKMGISYSVIARRLEIPRDKIINIKRGSSSADDELLTKLLKTFPELSGDNSNQASDFASREEELLAEVERLKKIVAEKEARIMKLIDIAYSNTKEQD